MMHPWTWLIVGFVMMVSGMWLGPSFDAAVWIGIIVFGVGVWFAVSGYIPRKGESHAEHRFAHHVNSTRHAIHYLKCLSCKAVVRSTDFYCWKCGKRLRS